MNLPETAQLLSLAAAYDQRTIGESDVHAWHYQIGDLDYRDAVDAVKRHYRDSKERIAPTDVRRLIKAARGRRVALSEIQPPDDIDPDDVAAYNAWMRRRLAEAADGIAQAKALPSTPPPPDYTRRRGDHAEDRALALSVPCPWCGAARRSGCVTPGTQQPLTKSPAHPSRLETAREANRKESA